MNIFISIFGIYVFIMLGFFAKKFFKKRMDEKSLVLVSIYFLQPMLVFWGLTVKKIDFSVMMAPAVYLIAIFISLILGLLLAKFFYKDQKDISIATVSGIVGNTGNLGIPLGIAIFGEASVIYTSLINLANVFIVYSVGVYFYSRGSLSPGKSLINIIKLPAIWFGLFAIFFNIFDGKVPEALMMPLEMGAYATMVLQLMIFGMYLYSIELKKVNLNLFAFVGLMKFIIIPLLGVAILSFFDVSGLVYGVILLELVVPLAVMNVNLASLYDCKPVQVVFLTFATSMIFLFYIFILIYFMKDIFVQFK